jgi:hypothetical protein
VVFSTGQTVACGAKPWCARNAADLEIGDTADSELCATNKRRPSDLLPPPLLFFGEIFHERFGQVIMAQQVAIFGHVKRFTKW